MITLVIRSGRLNGALRSYPCCASDERLPVCDKSLLDAPSSLIDHDRFSSPECGMQCALIDFPGKP